MPWWGWLAVGALIALIVLVCWGLRVVARMWNG